MAVPSSALPATRFTDGIYDQGISDVLRGLMSIPRQISSTWLYDERGSRLFERICELPEYYITRTESAILQQHAAAIADELGSGITLIDYGSGNSGKVQLLLRQLRQPAAYVPIDIAASSLARAARQIRRHHPGLTVAPLCANFTQSPALPPQVAAGRRVLFFPGSTLGNFDSGEATRLLARMRAQAGTDGLALVGIDLAKDPAMLERAYDDVAGVTAQFNLNALRHLNRRLGTCFEVPQFRHRAQWVPAQQRIEMHLVSATHQTIRLGAAVVRLRRGDYVRTECSHKYSLAGFAQLVAAAGWRLRNHWSDAAQWFSVQLLEPA